MTVNPPRPTAARLRSLIKKYDRIIEEINLMTRGNTLAADTSKLAQLKYVGHQSEVQRNNLERLLGVKG